MKDVKVVRCKHALVCVTWLTSSTSDFTASQELRISGEASRVDHRVASPQNILRMSRLTQAFGEFQQSVSYAYIEGLS